MSQPQGPSLSGKNLVEKWQQHNVLLEWGKAGERKKFSQGEGKGVCKGEGRQQVRSRVEPD